MGLGYDITPPLRVWHKHIMSAAKKKESEHTVMSNECSSYEALTTGRIHFLSAEMSYCLNNLIS